MQVPAVVFVFSGNYLSVQTIQISGAHVRSVVHGHSLYCLSAHHSNSGSPYTTKVLDAAMESVVRTNCDAAFPLSFVKQRWELWTSCECCVVSVRTQVVSSLAQPPLRIKRKGLVTQAYSSLLTYYVC